MTMNSYLFANLYRFVLILALVCFNLSAFAQNVNLRTQAEVDAFDQNITIIDGNLSIDPIVDDVSDISDLSPLSNITSINGSLSIRKNPLLTSISQFQNLDKIRGSLTIHKNDSLNNLDGLENITSVFGLINISVNESLENIDALYGLEEIGSYLLISNNESLVEINGFNNILSIGGYISILENESLKEIIGFNKFKTIEGRISISGNNSLLYVDGFNSFRETRENIRVGFNNSLKSVTGFKNLDLIGGSLNVFFNGALQECCAFRDILENASTRIEGDININGNSVGCGNQTEVLSSYCGMKINSATFQPCEDEQNGGIIIFISDYDTSPFSYEWIRIEDGTTGSGISEVDEFTIDLSGEGTYNITVTNDKPDTVRLNNIILSEETDNNFEFEQILVTNSSNGLNNGIIDITISGGTGPYSYHWSGAWTGCEEGLESQSYTIEALANGEYRIMVIDGLGNRRVINVTLIDETIESISCEKPYDIIILSDVSDSVFPEEYYSIKKFFIKFLTTLNLGSEPNDSRGAIIEWSGDTQQKVVIPFTGDTTIIKNYIDSTRAFSNGTVPYQAIKFGRTYMENNARENAEKVLLISTDGTSSDISHGLIDYAQILHAEGYHVITHGFDDAFRSQTVISRLKRMASSNILAIGAIDYYTPIGNTDIQNIVNNYLCPVNPGSTGIAKFNRDGSIQIIDVKIVGNCPEPENVEATILISAERELPMPEGTPVTFYSNDPTLFGNTPLLTWHIPCKIVQGSAETYTVTLPISHAANIYAVLNDNGEQISPINFPITNIEEVSYINNIDSEKICLDAGATVQATKYANTTSPICNSLVNYTINVCNISEEDAYGVTVTDINPTGFDLVGRVFIGNGCTENQDGLYDIPAECCFSLSITYNTASASLGSYDNQGVALDGPSNQTYIDFDGSTTTDEDVNIDGTIDCPSTIIEFEKSVNEEEICDDQFVQFGYTIRNELNIPLQGLVLRDTLPEPCSWTFEPYDELELSFGIIEVDENILTIFINQVNANTEAVFYMDAYLDTWSFDGTLESNALIENVIDVENEGYNSIKSNTATTKINVTPSIGIQDTIFISDMDTVELDALIQGEAEIFWTSDGDGIFVNPENESTDYILGESDYTNEFVNLGITLISDCGESYQLLVLKRLVDILDVEEVNKRGEGVLAFPSPANDIIFFTAKENGLLRNIKIFNSDGQRLIDIEKNTSRTKLNIDFLKAGIYFYSVEINERRYYGKFLKI